MYTQCSKCETVFKLSAAVLRAAGGQVRCGRCGEVFNALTRLAEDQTAFAIGEALGESSLDLETRADSILESAAAEEPAPGAAEGEAAQGDEAFAPPGVEIARLEVLDWPEEEDLAQDQDTDVREGDVEAVADANPEADASHPETLDDRSLEFTLPPGELDRIFIEPKKRASLPLPPMQQPTPPEALELVADPYPEPPPHPESLGLDAASMAAEPTRTRISGFEVPEDVRRDMLSGFEQQLRPASVLRTFTRDNAQRRPLMLWLCAAIVSMLLLIVQAVYQNRGRWAPPAQASFSAYQLRQWGVTGDPDATGTLRLRASIQNAGALAQPYPLLRVTLADRFGKSIGRRDFEPTEYLGKPTARLLAPGERVDATLEILDPGKRAEGFELDVCLRGVDRRIACANDIAGQTRR